MVAKSFLKRERSGGAMMIVLLIVLAGTLLLAAHQGGARVQQAAQYEIAECPAHWEYLPKRLGGRVASYGFPLVGPITNVPEFHDCQRLLNADGSRYGPLVAVFASYELDSLEEHLSIVERGRAVGDAPDRLRQAALQGRRALAAALIVNLDRNPYSPLGIASGFSCLYTWRETGDTSVWSASIVSVDSAQKCLQPVVPGQLEATALQVYRDVVDGVEALELDPYPAVARWDRDSRSGVHYIGIKCGRAWCEIGTGPVTRSALHTGVTPASSGELRRRVKGWYDEQLLAHENANGNIVPSSLIGTVFPDSMLDARSIGAFDNVWVPVSYIALSARSQYYKRILNLDAAPATAPFSQMNRLSLCRGWRSDCGVPNVSDPLGRTANCGPDEHFTEPRWWVRIEPAGGGDPMYRCVVRTGHEDLRKEIPATARWRWLAHDETVWQECLEGCCKVTVDET